MDVMTQAERLIDLADAILLPRDHLLAMPVRLDSQRMALAALAIKFRRLPKIVQLMAQVENWSHERIVRECY
jgi:hypothetical protein